MQGAGPVLSCQARHRRRSHPRTTLSRRLRVRAAEVARTGAGRGEGVGVQREGAASRAWRSVGGCCARAT